MSINAQTSQTGEAPVTIVPPLETGDCLARPEFERRYEAMPWLKKAELIDGVVYVGSPVGILHAEADARLTGLLGMYAAHTPGVQCAGNATLRLDMLNEVQPDSLLRLAAGGRSRVEPEKQYLEGSPELVAEVAASSVSRDLHSKLRLYLRHAVPEYLVWRVLDGEVDWFRLEAGEYQRLTADANGILRSREFPGLWLDQPALLRGDMASAMATLNQGLNSPEHEEWAARR
ncbi:MAG TPA: Uma2 family endonuclease [Pirellulales bacterium]